MPEQLINEEKEENVEITEITQPTKLCQQYSNNLNKCTFKPIITIPNNNSLLDDVLTDDKPQ